MKILPCAALGSVIALCGCSAPADSTDNVALVEKAQAGADVFAGKLIVSETTTAVGSLITVTEVATNLTSSSVGPIIMGLSRLAFDVVASDPPPTGRCRIAGSVTCNFVQLAPGETQSLTLSLAPQAPGTYVIKGWTRSSYQAGGSLEMLNVTVQ